MQTCLRVIQTLPANSSPMSHGCHHIRRCYAIGCTFTCYIIVQNYNAHAARDEAVHGVLTLAFIVTPQARFLPAQRGERSRN